MNGMFVTPHALFKINKATTTEIIGSAIYHENNDISTPATNAPTDPKASPRTCKYALRKFTLFSHHLVSSVPMH